jgi:hypothetical protein
MARKNASANAGEDRYAKNGVVKQPNPLTPHVEGTTKPRKKDGKAFVHREKPTKGVRKQRGG